VHRLFRERTRLALDDVVRFDHHAFPIELLNKSGGTRHGSDSEIPSLGTLEPDAGWQLWQGPDYRYPNTVLLAFEAVLAVKAQSMQLSEDLDRAIRRAFWAESRSIHMHHELITIAQQIPGINVNQLQTDLANGTYRSAVFADAELAPSDAVSMSPHLFLPDGTNITNPELTITGKATGNRAFPSSTTTNHPCMQPSSTLQPPYEVPLARMTEAAASPPDLQRQFKASPCLTTPGGCAGLSKCSCELVVMLGPPATRPVESFAATGSVPQRDGARVSGLNSINY
jgi:predicted hotdog family 3-hydroxylacyl-ACP dehydratase